MYICIYIYIYIYTDSLLPNATKVRAQRVTCQLCLSLAHSTRPLKPTPAKHSTRRGRKMAHKVRLLT